ncbi:ESCRT-related protein CHMP1A [Gracilariopsis chorda]|uniref:ESCRT-related protein CHMP1A n=1 Tax=Gracilariopsis chorda TaxID=448386 RepID=A0A2V3IUC9_9FLOR|nr:ESCRT-related protein CHMP1A [Gracilariopsis chorda]|eukprot:PXF45722.1 ESCRT-related protein CHMP1A [Gracilariopsis chorda]
MGLFSRKAPPPPAPVQQAPPPPTLQDIVFKMRFTSKTIGRQALKSQKQIDVEKRKAKEAMAKNNIAGARIHAENAIRNHNEHLSYLKLQSQLEAVAAKLQAQEVRQLVSQSMTAVTANLDQALNSMDATQIGYTMEQFIKQSEDLDLQTKYMDSAIGESTSSSTPQSQVNNLLQQIADENNLDVGDRLSGFNAPIGQPTAVSGQKVQDTDLMARLDALQGGARP